MTQPVAARARRATSLVHLGELSAAARALTAEPLAPGTPDTLSELNRDPERRPPTPYAPLPESALRHVPEEQCPVPWPAFLDGLRAAPRGSAAGPAAARRRPPACPCVTTPSGARRPSGRPPAHGCAPKAHGRVRALVVGDAFRRLWVACSQGTSPRSSRAGQGRAGQGKMRACHSSMDSQHTETCPRATILSVDAVGAFDHVSRGAMLGALLARRELHSLLPFARQFYSSPSVYTWCDDGGCPHEVIQGEGGEQGDPLMPAFYALAQHDALCDLTGQLRDGEAVFAFLDDVYIVALPENNALWDRARIRLHEGKTRIWNAAGEEPPAVADLGGDAREPVWVGD